MLWHTRYGRRFVSRRLWRYINIVFIIFFLDPKYFEHGEKGRTAVGGAQVCPELRSYTYTVYLHFVGRSVGPPHNFYHHKQRKERKKFYR